MIERGDQRIGIEVKSARGDQPRTVKLLEQALSDIEAQRGWIVDQAKGIDRLSARVARGGFAELLSGVP